MTKVTGAEIQTSQRSREDLHPTFYPPPNTSQDPIKKHASHHITGGVQQTKGQKEQNEHLHPETITGVPSEMEEGSSSSSWSLTIAFSSGWAAQCPLRTWCVCSPLTSS